MITERDGAAKATADTPLSFWKLPIQPVPLFTDGALHCKIPKHFSVYSLLHTHKNVYVIDISFQAVDQERNQSYSDTWKQERGHTIITSECCFSATPSCISCTLSCWARTQFPPWSWVGALGANIQRHRLETSSCWLHDEKAKATQAIPLTQIKSYVKHCVRSTGCQLLVLPPTSFPRVSAKCLPIAAHSVRWVWD